MYVLTDELKQSRFASCHKPDQKFVKLLITILEALWELKLHINVTSISVYTSIFSFEPKFYRANLVHRLVKLSNDLGTTYSAHRCEMPIYFPVGVWQAPFENSRVHRKQKM